MLSEFERIVTEAQPDWWLLENVSRVPDLQIEGYSWQRFALDLAWFTENSRLRHFQFGSKKGLLLDPPLGKKGQIKSTAALASDDRSFAELKGLQGLPADYDLPSFTVEGKKRAVGNGVPIPLGRVLAQLVDRDVYGVTCRQTNTVTSPGEETVTDQVIKNVTFRSDESVTDQSQIPVTSPGEVAVTRPASNRVTCACGCGRTVYGRAKYAGAACRKRASRRRSPL